MWLKITLANFFRIYHKDVCYIFRVDEAINSELEAINKWQQERRQVVHVEKQLSRVQSGQGVAKGRGKGYGSGGTGQERQGKPEDLDDLTTR